MEKINFNQFVRENSEFLSFVSLPKEQLIECGDA